MKRLTFFLLILLLTSVFAQDENSMDMQAAQQAWTEFMTPGDQHQRLAKAEGEWIVDQKYWMAPGTEAMASQGTATAEMIMGGRYLKTMHQGNVMGMPMEGMSLEAYDNAKEEFVSIWIDNMGTGLAYSTGKYDDESGILVYEGKMTDPMTKEDAWFKQTMKIVDDNTLYFEMFLKAPDGSEFKNMEITFKRK
ncbi:MAG: DUF1579 domain-containing protein [Melioribacteraceae bacterium]|nr:DUF1579 domain-containing protein [Melioribacteraceae bacterium]MCF8355065.1 DUF1579 domain-containing protein [Melioribacteraceae bacterium]MCF8395658.1 DUF1579 domain-containing protein [Melioribacteraceae bacterium]MCF8420283.1 DUF1579 domain-containing protein [Melioribacteraceae bacterium]